ncbi:MAG: TDT family transporter [Actinobacteria bacterium]|nr:TDT family transporter [Actinomycetota bacterium]MCB8997490.1 TDT family transporter [Actinomycetota bacterium]MCB9414765.1 TDT family transporter [Actinomycetota bacterium]MCB9423724.1 TDT family transporter [Actinomycetota bacterium]
MPQQSWIPRWLGVLGSPIEGRVIIGPNWFASVMGTAIVASAGATLPIPVPGIITTAAWALAVLLLVALLVFMPWNWARHPENLRNLADDPIAIQFFGAPPMALLAVAGATILVGQQYLGQGVAVGAAWVLWLIGTALGLLTAVAVPFRLFTALEVRHDGAFGGWLMPVVPPMVSAAVGALLVPHTPAGEPRQTMLFVCYALFGMSLMASVVIITLIWSRLAHFGTSGSARVPTLWMVLGPVGQSITAAGALGTAALGALPPPLSTALDAFAVVFGVPMWGFMLLWLPLATALTLRAHRRNMGFALTWWSFTFPVGTCVMGTSQLAAHTDLTMFTGVAVALYTLLLVAWVTVAIRTYRQSVSGGLLTPPPVSPHAVAQKG